MAIVNVQIPVGITPPGVKSVANKRLFSVKNNDGSLQTVYEFINLPRQHHHVQKYVFPVAVKSMKIDEQRWKPAFSPVCSIFQKCYIPTSKLGVKRIESPDNIMTGDMLPKPEIGVAVFILKDNKILLGRRRSLSIAANVYSVPGGHLEPGESHEECGAREVNEETGLYIKKMKILTTKKLKYNATPLLVTYMSAHLSDPNQTPQNIEPNKCEGWEWYDLHNLPEPMFEPLKEMLQDGFNLFI